MENNLNYELSEYIKLLRFKSKLSQEEAANMLNVSRNTYSKWETNPQQLDLEQLVNIGKIFNSDILIFFNQYVAKCNDNKEII